MRTARMDHMWLVGGAVGAVVLLVVGWFFLIGPKRSETASLNDMTQAALDQQGILAHRLVDLRQQSLRLDEYQAQLAVGLLALPGSPALTEFVRELHSAGDRSGVAVKAFIASAPELVTAEGTLFSIDISVTSEGSAVNQTRFLDQLQAVQPRAVLITSVNAEAGEEGGSLADSTTMTMSLQAFVAPQTRPAAAPTPAPTK